MKRIKKTFIIIALLVFMVILLANQKVFANSSVNLLERLEYSEDFNKWLKLTDEEKKKTIMPRMYEVPYTKVKYRNPLYKAKMVKASMNSRYSLKDIIPSNLTIRDQQQTNLCWAFASLSSLETNLALSNYKKGIDLSKTYDFSERHLEYATSRWFANGVENPTGYNRNVGDGGNFFIANSYLTNGIGAIPETEMPFENNENIIDITEIQNKTVSSQLYDTIDFPEYGTKTDAEKTEIINQIKQHIQNYGSVFALVHGESGSTLGNRCYNDNTGAKFCNNSDEHKINHCVSIIGWDDNYSIDNFFEGNKPTSNGAWIARNSWGEKVKLGKVTDLKQEIFNTYKDLCIEKGWNTAQEVPNELIIQSGFIIEGDMLYIKYGDNGLIYISYEDVNISKAMSGIIKATDTVNYDNIYYYDELSATAYIVVNAPNIMLSNIFNKKTTGTEYLTQVSLYAPHTYTCKVYVNPNGTSKASNDLQLVSLKAGESETFDAGYHTLEFSKPIEIKSNSFAVVVEIQSVGDKTMLLLEGKSTSPIENIYSSSKIENGKCFLATGNNLGNCKWYDLGKVSEGGTSLPDGDSTLKAFTTSELVDESLKNIEIITPPSKTTYFEGENFDKTGMVVKANYNSKINPYVILDSSSYSITNGTNLKADQKYVTIVYEDKSVNQKITVEKNSVTELKIKIPPTKTEYKEGQGFDKTNMVIEATYKDGTTKIISDYTVENGNNLKANQTQVTISYGEKTIVQPIKVIPNPLEEIKVTKAPNKTKYVVGQNFDKTGMVVTGIYKDKTTQEILDYTIENGTNLTKEQSYVTIKYEGKTVTQSIVVEEKTIIEISISKKPSKIQYIQNKEELDLTGGTLKVKYNNNSSEEISLTYEQVRVTGFNNKKVGKNTITITYQNQTTTLDLEIVAEVVAKNSNFDNANCNINSVKYYTFSNKDIQEYIIIDITINGIIRNTENDICEYYYCLTSNKDENNIQNWVKVKEDQIFYDKLVFEINTKDIKNYEDTSNSNTIYLYIKEVAIKSGSQSVLVSKPINIDSNATIETYLNNVKVNNSNSDNSGDSEISNTGNGEVVTPNKLPETGIRNVLFLIPIVLILGSIFYIKYKNLSKHLK